MSRKHELKSLLPLRAHLRGTPLLCGPVSGPDSVLIGLLSSDGSPDGTSSESMACIESNFRAHAVGFKPDRAAYDLQ